MQPTLPDSPAARNRKPLTQLERPQNPPPFEDSALEQATTTSTPTAAKSVGDGACPECDCPVAPPLVSNLCPRCLFTLPFTSQSPSTGTAMVSVTGSNSDDNFEEAGGLVGASSSCLPVGGDDTPPPISGQERRPKDRGRVVPDGPFAVPPELARRLVQWSWMLALGQIRSVDYWAWAKSAIEGWVTSPPTTPQAMICRLTHLGSLQIVPAEMMISLGRFIGHRIDYPFPPVYDSRRARYVFADPDHQSFSSMEDGMVALDKAYLPHFKKGRNGGALMAHRCFHPGCTLVSLLKKETDGDGNTVYVPRIGNIPPLPEGRPRHTNHSLDDSEYNEVKNKLRPLTGFLKSIILEHRRNVGSGKFTRDSAVAYLQDHAITSQLPLLTNHKACKVLETSVAAFVSQLREKEASDDELPPLPEGHPRHTNNSPDDSGDSSRQPAIRPIFPRNARNELMAALNELMAARASPTNVLFPFPSLAICFRAIPNVLRCSPLRRTTLFSLLRPPLHHHHQHQLSQHHHQQHHQRLLFLLLSKMCRLLY